MSSLAPIRLSPAFFDCAESALLVDFGPQYSKRLSLGIHKLSELLLASMLPGLEENIPAASSLTVFYDPALLPKERLISEIIARCNTCVGDELRGRIWEIPVHYGGEGGPDLESVADCTGLTQEEVIALHAGQVYNVYMLGFLPGFGYLGDLPEKLWLSRRSTPRARVPAGSVAIAAEMTAIYPLESPGGWHLIGYTPVTLWDLARSEEPLFRPGDQVRFKPISREEAGELRRRAPGWLPGYVEAK